MGPPTGRRRRGRYFWLGADNGAEGTVWENVNSCAAMLPVIWCASGQGRGGKKEVLGTVDGGSVGAVDSRTRRSDSGEVMLVLVLHVCRLYACLQTRARATN